MLPWLLTASALFLLLAAWGLYLTRHGGEADGWGAYNRLQRGWRRVAFWAGDVCILRHFPWITWDKRECRVSDEEWLGIIARLEAGDIILATHANYPLSNWAIPGCFKHAGFVSCGCAWDGEEDTDRAIALCDARTARVVEAVSEGVMEWSPLRMRADRMIVLRPRGTTLEEVERAVRTARRIVGCAYDAGFKFNIEEEMAQLDKDNTQDKLMAVREISYAAASLVASFDMAFSCTEVVALAWWHKREALRLFRRRSRGRSVIVADQLVNGGFEVVWTNVSAEEAERCGLHEEGVALLKRHWEGQPHASAH